MISSRNKVLGVSGATSLRKWLLAERWTRMPLVGYGNLYDMGLCCDKLLVLAVLDLVKKKKDPPTKKYDCYQLFCLRVLHRSLLSDLRIWSTKLSSSITIGYIRIFSSDGLTATSLRTVSSQEQCLFQAWWSSTLAHTSFSCPKTSRSK